MKRVSYTVAAATFLISNLAFATETRIGLFQDGNANLSPGLISPTLPHPSEAAPENNPFFLFDTKRSRGNTTIDDRTVIIGTGGGDCAGLNDTIAMLVKKLNQNGYRVLGIKNCYDGMVNDNWQGLLVELTPEIADTIYGLPSTVLGSCRRKLSEQDLALIIERFKGSAGLVITGGNDHLKDAAHIASYSTEKNTPITTVGIPKSIDDDFQTAMLGFKSAYLLGRRIAARASIDPAHSGGDVAAVFEVMGRKSGSLTVEVSKGCQYPKAVIIPEKPVAIDEIIEAYKAGRRNFFVSEGFSLSAEDPKLQTLLDADSVLKHMYAKSTTSPDRDTHGNPKLTGASLFVVGILRHFCNAKIERTDITYQLRGAALQADEGKDGEEAFDSFLAKGFADKAVSILCDGQKRSGLALTYPSYDDREKWVEAKPADQVYLPKNLSAVSDGELKGLGVIGARASGEMEQKVFARTPTISRTAEDEARRLFYDIGISTLVHRSASCVELRLPSKTIIAACAGIRNTPPDTPKHLKTVIGAVGDSTVILVPEQYESFEDIGRRVLEIYKTFGYVNVAVSNDFRLRKDDALLQSILGKDRILKARYDRDVVDAGDGLVRFDSGVSNFIVALFKEIGIKATRTTDLGYAFRGLTDDAMPHPADGSGVSLRPGGAQVVEEMQAVGQELLVARRGLTALGLVFDEVPAPDKPSSGEIASFYQIYELLQTHRIEIYLPKNTALALAGPAKEWIKALNKRIRQRNGGSGEDAIKIIPFNGSNLSTVLGRKADGVKRLFVNNLQAMPLFTAAAKAGLLNGNRFFTVDIPASGSDAEDAFNHAWLMKISILSCLLDENNKAMVGAALQAELEGRIVGETDTFINNLAVADNANIDVDTARAHIRYFLDTVVRLSTIIGRRLRLLIAFWTAA